MQYNIRRLVIDLVGLALLIGPLLLHILPSSSGLLMLLSIPLIVGFIRGLAERYFLREIRRLMATFEWALIVFVADIILCISSSKTDSHANFMTIFGAFFLVFIIPSIALSTGGFLAAITWQTGRRAA